jgi:hypothetical protein
MSEVVFAVGLGALALGVIAVWGLSLWLFWRDFEKSWSRGDFGWALGSMAILTLVAFFPPTLVGVILSEIGL